MAPATRLTLGALRAALRPQAIAVRSFHSSIRRHEQFLNADSATFQKAVANKDKVVLVDFYATWCQPCKMLSPILEKIAADPSTNTDLVTVDTDEHSDLAMEYEVAALPTVVAFKGGKPVSRFVGALHEHDPHKASILPRATALPAPMRMHKIDGRIRRLANQEIVLSIA
ncbi:hypothetical protein POSPLADRAFT_1069371 [Postia placenta MAD-698-R-SB12]|uniref:Thioredoxin domain-containing protein n=1 Tax=Postia placenta MAD-698-R-SB12 TaxID=670580 RepID=A0A1X6N9R5_9APHY|nr:hypothetical protein POSPLADRAFT_1069371 [Postia placenta MAD-698-R-SB12]OSX65351.1 hypothetical protein POSPLADRAFT_1069371 [Postia placenta MAD-698-R-SB12]